MATLTFPDELLRATEMTEQEMAAELAIALYQRNKVSLGQAALLAGMRKLAFQRLLASRNIPVNYGVEDFQSDIETLRALGHL